MFYTGIITSLLPYILILGVFGTLFLNQTFAGAPASDDVKTEHHQWADNASSGQSPDTYSISFDQSEEKPNNRPDNPKGQGTMPGIPTFSPPGFSTSYFQSTAPRIARTGMNRTYSLRGPPQI